MKALNQIEEKCSIKCLVYFSLSLCKSMLNLSFFLTRPELGFKKKNFFKVYLLLRQRETEHERGRVRERETYNLKQAPGSELSAQSPTRGLNSGRGDHDLSRSRQLNRLSHPGAPLFISLKNT